MPPKTNPVDPLAERKKIIRARLDCSEQDVAAVLLDRAADKFTYEVELSELECLNRDIHQLQNAAIQASADSDVFAVAQEFTPFLKRLKVLKSQILRCLSPTAPAPPEPLAAPAGGGDAAAPVQQVIPDVKLPKLELPQFSGGALEWKSFKDRFVAAVHSKNLPGSLKLQYLLGQLTGDAAQFLQGVTISDDSYDGAWNALVQRYQNNREITRAYLDKFFNQENMKPGSSTSMRSILDTTNEFIRNIKSMNPEVDPWDLFISHIVSRNLDADTIRQWELQFKDDSYPKCQKLLEFLDHRARAFAASESTSTSCPNYESRNVQQIPRCANCNAEHPLYLCPKFLGMSVAQRRDWVKSKNLCFNCLRKGHSTEQCNIRPCKTCAQKHHSLLHFESN